MLYGAMFKVQDHFFHKAKLEGNLARSYYKLEEIDKKFRLINSHQRLLDCGYYPGSWGQYIVKKIGNEGFLCGVDIQKPTHNLGPNARLLQKDITSIKSLEDLEVDTPFHGIVSDMAPNTTGNILVDQMSQLRLVEWVFDLVPILLKKNGYMVIKIFESADSVLLIQEKKKLFEKGNYFRPKAIRSSSKETYWIGQNYRH